MVAAAVLYHLLRGIEFGKVIAALEAQSPWRIAIAGALVIAGAHKTPLSTILGFVAVTFSTINVVGGFLITDRMLRMFKKKDTTQKPKK